MVALIQVPTSSTEPQWFYTRAELDRSPSVRAGMSLRDEREMRQKAIHAVWQLKDGVELCVPSPCVLVELYRYPRELTVVARFALLDSGNKLPCRPRLPCCTASTCERRSRSSTTSCAPSPSPFIRSFANLSSSPFRRPPPVPPSSSLPSLKKSPNLSNASPKFSTTSAGASTVAKRSTSACRKRGTASFSTCARRSQSLRRRC